MMYEKKSQYMEIKGFHPTMGARHFLVAEMIKIFNNQCIELLISNIMAGQSIFKSIFSCTQTPFHKSLRPQQWLHVVDGQYLTDRPMRKEAKVILITWIV